MLLVLYESRPGQVYGENASYSDENDMKANLHLSLCLQILRVPFCPLRHEKNDETCSFILDFIRTGPGGSDIALGSNKSLCCL